MKFRMQFIHRDEEHVPMPHRGVLRHSIRCGNGKGDRGHAQDQETHELLESGVRCSRKWSHDRNRWHTVWVR